MQRVELYTYCKSSAAYRVRIALHYKNIEHHSHFISLIHNGGENFSPQYRALNPQAMIPTLKVDENVITQSLAILEYLEECFGSPSLLPDKPIDRARVRAYAQLICCDIHPLNNLRILDYIQDTLQQDAQAKTSWYQHWIAEGFNALEMMLSKSNSTGEFCYGDKPGLADICLIPQVYNAVRFDCDMSHYPMINRIVENCSKLEAFIQAKPENQADYTG